MTDKEEVRESIVDTARIIFSKYGFKKTTMDDIARANHKGKSSMYYYFTSKEEVYEAVVEKESRILKNELSKAISLGKSPLEKLENYVMTRMIAFNNLANFYHAIKSEYLSHLEFIEGIRKKYDNEEVIMVEAILNEGTNANLFNIEEPHLTAIAIVTAMKGLEIPLFWASKEKDLEQRQKQLLNILFYGIVKR